MYYAEKDECDTEGSVDDTEASSSGASSPPSGFSLANPQIAEKSQIWLLAPVWTLG